jgi:uncharacterized protein
MKDTIYVNGKEFNTLVAVTPEEHQVGLMWRKWPPPIMTFPYNTAQVRKFWMKNTISPLDIIFCRANVVVGIFRGEPLSTALVGPNTASDLVVEFPAGTADQIGLQVGDSIRFKPAIETLARTLHSFS